MKTRIEELRARFNEALGAAADGAALENLRVEYLGKKGHVAALMQGLRDVSDKREAGQLINTLKTEVEAAIAEAGEALRAAAVAARIRSAKKYNPTLRGAEELGSYHPITLVQRDLERIFASMGFAIENYSAKNKTAAHTDSSLYLKV